MKRNYFKQIISKSDEGTKRETHSPLPSSSPKHVNIFNIKSSNFYILLGAHGPLIAQKGLAVH